LRARHRKPLRVRLGNGQTAIDLSLKRCNFAMSGILRLRLRHTFELKQICPDESAKG
jgi:hypothetical protein